MYTIYIYIDSYSSYTWLWQFAESAQYNARGAVVPESWTRVSGGCGGCVKGLATWVVVVRVIACIPIYICIRYATSWAGRPLVILWQRNTKCRFILISAVVVYASPGPPETHPPYLSSPESGRVKLSRGKQYGWTIYTHNTLYACTSSVEETPNSNER